MIALIPAALPMPKIVGGAVLVSLWLTKGYWLVPVIIKGQKQAASGKATPLVPVPDASVFPVEMQAPLNRHAMALVELGFTATPIMRDSSGASKGAVQMFEHAANRDVATLIVMPREGDEPVVLVGFTSQLADGRRISTSNDPIGSVFPPEPKSSSARFPGELQAKRLYPLHRAHVAHAAKSTRQVPLPLGDAAAYQRRIEERGFRWWQDCGFVRPENGVLRYTWKGAILACWKLQAPWKTRILARDERLRQDLLARAGLAA